jgi:hypothetical protein
MNPLAIPILLIIAAIVLVRYRTSLTRRREAFITAYHFPPSFSHKVKAKYPHLTEEQQALVIEGLKEYFQICRQAGRTLVSMPSQVADVAWHEFILFTHAYREFCHRALGRFLHHTPAQAMKTPTLAQQGIKRAWRIACAREGIDPTTPACLPLLFAIDAQLGIPDGFKYSLDCQGAGTDYYCATHIGCASGCAGDSSCSSSSCDSDSSGCDSGSGDCGGSCGGGCGGGD